MADLHLRGDHILTQARGHAIQSYTSIEFSLCMFLAHLMGTSHEIAGVIFFRVINTRSRNLILSELYRQKHGEAFTVYWKSLLKQIQSLDQRRNEIIHWHMITKISTDDPTMAIGRLMPPNYWGHDENTPALGLPEITEFIQKCDVTSRSMNTLWAHLSGAHSRDDDPTWLEIFQKPLDYPLPDDHPLSRNHKAPEGPPEPSGA